MIVVERVTKARDKKTVVDDLSFTCTPGVVKGRLGPDGHTSAVRFRKHAIRQVEVLEVTGRLADGVEDLDRAIQLALAEGPRGVACDLSHVEDADPDAVAMLATAGRHVRDWHGTPVAVACPDPQVREALHAQPLGGHLILAASLFSAISEVLAAPAVSVDSQRLASHPTASRAAREFVTRTLLDWRLGRVIPVASRVVGELVSSSSIDAGTDIDVSLAWDQGALRLTVLDHGPALPGQWPCAPDRHRRALTVVAGISRAFGVLPTADGGKVVWAVLDAPRTQCSTKQIRSQHGIAFPQPPVFNDGRGLAQLPFCAGSSRQPVGGQAALN